MIHEILPVQYARRADARFSEPYKRLMAAVLQTVLDDCRGSTYRRARGYQTPVDAREIERAAAYVASEDRSWPFSFVNLCEALGLNPGNLRKGIQRAEKIQLPDAALG